MQVNRIHFETIDSTNTWAKQRLDTFEKEKLTLITADKQTAGRGQFNRKWQSIPGQSICASYCFFLPLYLPEMGILAQLFALSLCRILHSLGFFPQVKWPNDILLKGEKVAGILCETVPLEKGIGVVIGVGLNVNMELQLQKIDQPATSLKVDSSSSVDLNLEEILDLLTQQFSYDLRLFMQQGFTPFEEELKNLSS